MYCQNMSIDVRWSLINSCRCGNLEEVQHILSKYSLSEYPEWLEGYFLICESLKNKQIEITKFLLQNEAKVNIVTKDRLSSNTPLHHAVYIESMEIIKILLDKQADLNATNKDKRSPLHLAVEQVNEKIVKLLVERGADLRLIDRQGYTSLHLAARNSNAKIVEHLINYGADVNCIGKGITALYIAIEHSNLDVVKLLLRNGATVDSSYITSYNLLQLAVCHDNVEILKLLLKYTYEVQENFGHDLNVHNTVDEVKSQITPLHTAAVTRNVHKIVKSDNETKHVNADCLSLPTPLQTDFDYSVEKVTAGTVNHLQSNNHENTNDIQSPHTYLGNNYVEVEGIVQRNSTSEDVRTILHTALIMKKKEMVNVLLNHGFDTNARNEFGRTPMYYAYKYNDLDMCKCLLDHGACINSLLNQDLYLLHMAVENKDEEFVRFLLSQDTDVNVTMNDSSTSLHIASRKGYKRIVKLLLKHNADVHMKDNKGFTSLHEASKLGNERIVKLLFHKGSDVNAVTNCMSTSLHFAVQCNQETVVTRLLKYGANVNAKDIKNKTALCYAVEIGSISVVRMLLNQNLDCNEKHHKLAFCLAILGNREEHSNIVEIFLFRGFTIISKDFNNFQIPEPLNARYINDCNREEYIRILKKLLKRESSANAFFEYQVLRNSIEKGFLKIVKDLLRRDVNINISLEEGCTLLHIAVGNGQLWIAEELLNRGAKVNAVDIRGRSPLHISVLNNFTDVVAFLIKYKADLELRDEDGKTALHLAADGKDHIARLLLDAGANVNSSSRNNSRPLHVAAERGHLNIVELLLDYEAEINVKNRNSETPLDLAVYSQDIEIVNILLCSGAIYNASSVPAYVYHTDIYKLMILHSIRLYELDMNSGELKIGHQYVDFQSSCKEELERMALEQIGINVSLFDILTKEDSIVEIFIRNHSILQFFDSADYQKLFPRYADMLKIRVDRAKKKIKLEELSAISLETMLEIKIPNLVIQKIFSYVNNTDLRNVILATSAE